MKRSIISICLLLHAFTLFAQDVKPVRTSRFYLRLGGTYSFAHAGQTTIDQSRMLNGHTSNTTSNPPGPGSYGTSWNVRGASFGAGVTGVFTIGCLVTKGVGIELGVSMGANSKKYKSEYTNSNYVPPAYEIRTTTTYYQKSPKLFFPSIVVQTAWGAINVYSRIGAAIPLGGRQVWEYKAEDREWTIELRNKFAVGFQGALGAQIPLTRRIKFYLEAGGVSLNAYADESKLISASENGMAVPQYGTSTVAYYEFEGYNSSYRPVGMPVEYPTFSSPYSSIGIGAGLFISL
jgi:hypothetical protein